MNSNYTQIVVEFQYVLQKKRPLNAVGRYGKTRVPILLSPAYKGRSLQCGRNLEPGESSAPAARAGDDVFTFAVEFTIFATGLPLFIGRIFFVRLWLLTIQLSMAN
jgi:hypothetical protein